MVVVVGVIVVELYKLYKLCNYHKKGRESNVYMPHTSVIQHRQPMQHSVLCNVHDLQSLQVVLVGLFRAFVVVYNTVF
jgi:hypothetical protein